jgi:large subunit ribosomal protein L15
MKLETQPKTTKRSKKRVGRGYGSGKGGHTAGRGSKGQKSRTKVPAHFEGVAMGGSLIKRLPLLRGKGKLKSTKNRPIVVDARYLGLLGEGKTIDVATLAKHNIVKKAEAERYGVKVLGNAAVPKNMTLAVPASKSVVKRIEKAGGNLKSAKPVKKPKAKAVKSKKSK